MRQMTGTIQDYAWGTTDAIPQLLGIEPTGEPQAEYWLGAHSCAPSIVEGQPLDQMIASNPAIVGEASTERFGDCLPYLLKLLSANQALSLQAHPTREQAEEGFARENADGVALDDPKRTYKDPWPKPEMMLALTPFEALCGFRKPADTVALFEALNVPGLGQMIKPLMMRSGGAGLAEVFLDALTVSDERRQLAVEVVARAVQHVEDEDEVGRLSRMAVLLDESYPGDPTILAALLMNQITLQPGDAIFLPAGNLHAYVQGTGVEVMANSDNVLRGGLTRKHIDVDELVRVVDFDAAPVELVRTEPVAPGLTRYLTPAPEFVLWRLDAEGQTVELPATGLGRVLHVIDGEFTGQDGTELGKGRSAFIEAGEQASVTGTGLAFLAAPGV